MTSFMEEFEHLKIQLDEIKRATNSFRNRVIGAGGFGAVYEGEVSHSRGRSIVAIKRLNRQFGQGDPEFLKEIMLLSRYTHENLISLLGFCDEEDEKVLIYEHASKGSLDRHLSDPHLTWAQRIKICLGAAKGLCYLHDPKGTHQRVIHCDIKSANILLDESLTAKVADFGLSKMGPANQPYSVLVTDALGTRGYCDPLYMTTYTLTKESDVYSFGVVLFEVLCGRLCYQYSNGQVKVFVNMWKKKYSENQLSEIMFQHLKPQLDQASLDLFSEVAFQCLHDSREDRPMMSEVVEKLEKALQSLGLPEVYKEILNATVSPPRFRSIDDIYELFSNGVFLNDGRTWFSRNYHGEHYVLISIAKCLIPTGDPDYTRGWGSRFKVGCYTTSKAAFKTRAKTQFLSPLVTYRVNLVFKFERRNHSYKHDYLRLKYTLNGEKKVSIVHIANKREDEWLKASLYQFTSHERTVDLEFNFDQHDHCGGLEIEGIEFQPLEKVELELHQVLELKYGEILKATAHPLIFGSEVELNALLSRGVLLNEGKTWFSRNDRGVHYVVQSLEECLIHEAGNIVRYRSGYNSNRFPAGNYSKYNGRFKACVKTEFLTPLMTYTVNLVFKYTNEVWFDYKLDGETCSHTSHLAYKREDDLMRVELYHFTSDGTTVDLEIIFEHISGYILVEAIEFHPLENEELQVLENDHKHVNLEPRISDPEDDTYWKNKLPTDYKDIIKFSEQGLQWTGSKELYHILSQGLLIHYKPPFSFFQRPTNHGQQWFCLDKNGKTCLMLPARAVCMLESTNESEGIVLHEWKSLPESRFGEGLVTSSSNSNKHIVIKENKIRLLSPETKYACYLVYKIERGGCTSPMRVRYYPRDWGSWKYGSYIYLVSPQTPVIRPKAGQNTHNPLIRPRLKGIPQQRSDGWMEVQVWEFQTDTTAMTVIPSLSLDYQGTYHEDYLKGLIIIGIEFKPI
uniref:uncharacterized protein LOC122599568 n=1 Tax=Erigeron canadensis TaxID=72917 RepID=UPI001CB8EDDE|nr:uncharacterized protein LOC122599568 [Erigeron canadensis]